MTAPDPGLTDLIAEHAIVDMTMEGHGVQCKCQPFPADGNWMRADEWPAHVALVVEQHTNGRIAELEARIAEAQSLCHDTGRYNAARQKHWNIRVFACDVLAALKGRAALEGEQQ